MNLIVRVSFERFVLCYKHPDPAVRFWARYWRNRINEEWESWALMPQLPWNDSSEPEEEVG